MTVLVLLAAFFGAAALMNRGVALPFGIPSLPRWLKAILTALSAGALALLAVPSWWAIGVGAWTVREWASGHSDTTDLLDPSQAQGEDWLDALNTGGGLTAALALYLAVHGYPVAGAVALAGGMLKPGCYWLGGKLTPRPRHEPDNLASALHALSCWGAMAAAVVMTAA